MLPDREIAVSAARTRLLIVDDDSALLSNLRHYLTFRGCSVDRAQRWSDALALLYHVHYDAIVVGVPASNRQSAQDFARAARVVAREARLLAVSDPFATLADEQGDPAGFDEVVTRHLPLSQLVERLSSCIAT